MVVAATTLALTVGAVLPAISHAAAQTYCVHQAGFTCPAGTVDEGINLQTALTSAAANASTVTSPNVITIGPGIYPPDTSGTGFSVTSASNPIQIIGSGIGQTTLTDPAALAVLHLQWPAGSSVSELTVSGTDDTGIDMTGGTANDVAVAPGGSLFIGIRLVNATLRNATISMPQNGIVGVETAGGTGITSNEIDDVTVEGGEEGIEADAGTTIHRAKLITPTPLFVDDFPAYIDDSLLVGAQGIRVQDDPNEGSVNALNDTIVASGNTGDGVRADSDGHGGAEVDLTNSIVRGYSTSFAANGAQATIVRSSDNYDGTSSGSGLITGGAPVLGNPAFVNPGAGDYRLAWDSPLIDASNVSTLGAGSSTTDLDRNPRVVSYTHASTPVDLGAYEYQHREPTAFADVESYIGPPGTPIRFGGSFSSDPDDGDTLSYAWSFDDGATAIGVTVTHAFSTVGMHTARLTVTDPTGLISQATATTTVIPPPPFVGPPLVALPGLTTKPAPSHLSVLGKPLVTGNKLTLKLSCIGPTACTGIRITETTRKPTVQVASVTLRLSPGQTRTVTVTLNGKGNALLKPLAKLPVTIAVMIPIAGKAATVETAHATLHPPKKPRHRHP